jgi:hypothetical protein
LTPSVTPAAAEVFINISNATTAQQINNITVNGVQVTDVVFPIVAGDGASGKSTQTGTQTIVVFYSGGSGYYINVTDTQPVTTCVNTTGPSRTFAGQVLTAGYIAYIDFEDGACP